jgi:Zn-dependent oligopeptidase
MTYADNRELRKKLAIAFGARGFQNNEFDNQEIVLKSLNFVLNVHSYWVIPLTHTLY